MTDRELTRRSALSGAAIVVVGGAGGYAITRNTKAAKAKKGTTAANAYGADTTQTGKLLAAVDDIPDGGGKVIGDVVLTRSGATVHAFSAVCTHQGCLVDKVSDGQIECPCHGSRFDASTGAVTSSPASKPLPSINVVVREGKVYTS